MVATRGEWMQHGLAGRCVDALARELIRQTREDKVREDGVKVKIWVHAVEDLNGAYWEKKGWAVVRTYDKPVGHWGSISGYRLLVMLRNFELR